jgi:hypothetical protein
MKEKNVFAGRQEGGKERKKERNKNVIGGEGKEPHVAFSLISNKGEENPYSCTCSSAVVIFTR